MLALAILMLAATPDDLNPDCKTMTPATQLAMTTCAGKAWNDADADMNKAWATLKAATRALDAQDFQSCYPAPPNNGPKCLSYEQAALKAQRAWLAFRDADCVLSGYANRQSDMEAMLVFQCRESLTRERTKQLKDITTDLTEDHWK